MHEHLEIVMPPTDSIEAAVKEILAPFNENGSDEDSSGKYGFWDFWVIGGRFAGSKFQATLNADKLKEFHAELATRKVTVSGLTAGKQELQPTSQIPMVDALWNDYFPETNGGPCPLFKHSNDQYKNDSLLPDDVMHFRAVPETLEASRVIFAGPCHSGGGLMAHEMFVGSIYNGCTYQDTTWAGAFKGAVELFTKKTAGCREDWREKITPTDDWLVVTVDYHS